MTANQPTRSSRENLHQQLVRLLLGTGRMTEVDIANGVPLISSGLIDSVALFNLALWVEETIGAPVDLTKLSLPWQWDSVPLILDFIERSGSTAS